MDYKKIIAERLNSNIDLDVETIEKLIEIPPQSEMGDFAFPCFQLAKTLRKAPPIIAGELAEKIDKDGFEKVINMGPYINFFVDKSSLCKNTLEKVLEEGDKYGNSNIGEGKVITMDYSSPNIAKPFHVGHLFTTVIGNSLYKTYESQGYKPVAINHLGDWGTQFGKLISAFKRWGDEEALEKEPIKEMLRIYVKFHDEAEKNPELEDEGRMHFKNLEEGKEEEVMFWNKFKDCGLSDFQKLYDILHVKFDSYAGESFYNDKTDAIIKEIDEKGILVDSNGAKVVMLEEYNMPPCIVEKADGATIYATRDLAAAKYRKENYDFTKSLYIVGKDQALHFKQVFTTLKLMGYDWADNCTHIPFGLVKFADKKLSTRKGDVVFLEDVLNESVAKTLEVINEKNPELQDKEDVAKKVGIGAIVFTYLKNHRERDIVFDWKEMLSFEGETGPYVQYTYARGKSILRKFEGVKGEADYSKLTSKEEFELIKLLGNFQDACNFALEKYEPCMISRYVLDVAKAFNKFYNNHSIAATEDEGLKIARLKMVEATCQVIKNALYLLGIEVVEQM